MTASDQAPDGARRIRRNHALAWTVLAGLVVALHLPAVDNAFDNDDAWNYVLEAELALDGFQSAFKAGGNYLAWQNLHRLLPDASWVPRYALFDLWMPGWKLPSIALHAANAVLLGLLTLRLLRRVGAEGHAFAAAWVGAALFGLSPLHAQPVSWIGGTYDLLLGTMLLLALLAFDGGRDRLAAVAALAACLCKEQGVLVAPLLGLHALAFDGASWHGAGARPHPVGQHAPRWRRLLRAGAALLRRLWPTLAAVALVVVLRRVQMALATVEADPQLTRSVALDAVGLFHDAPLSALAGLATPLRAALGLSIPASVAVLGGALLAGLVLGGAWRRRTGAALFLLAAAVMFVVPVALLREFGRPLGLDRIVFNERYLYVSTLFVAALAGVALLHCQSATRRALAALAIAGTLVTGATAVATTTRPASPVPTLLSALRELRGPDRGGTTTDLYLLSSLYREETFRLALSRWILHHTGVRVHWVQRGAWRVLERTPDRTDGLDFMDFYVRVAKARFDPRQVQATHAVRLLMDRSPSSGHAVTTPELPLPGPRDAVTPEALPLVIDSVPGALSFTTEALPNGALRFGIGQVPNTPRGWPRRAAAWLKAPVDRERTLGVRITYTATARPEPVGLARAFEFGYLELHWTSRQQPVDLTYVVMPIAFDGQRHTETLWLDIDPVWAASGHVGALGIHPLDRAGEITLHAVDALALPRRRGPTSGD